MIRLIKRLVNKKLDPVKMKKIKMNDHKKFHNSGYSGFFIV